jgi:hypothetical protein
MHGEDASPPAVPPTGLPPGLPPIALKLPSKNYHPDTHPMGVFALF